jgi:hypothetical protein
MKRRTDEFCVRTVEKTLRKGKVQQAAENSAPSRKEIPQRLKPVILSIVYGPTEVVPGHKT